MSKKQSEEKRTESKKKGEKSERKSARAQFGFEMRPGYVLRGQIIPEEGDDGDDFDL